MTKTIKQCVECRHLKAQTNPADPYVCELAAAAEALTGFPILHTITFQRSSGFITDCGPGGAFFEPRV